MARLKDVEGVTLEPLWDQIVMPTAITAGPDSYQFFTQYKGQQDPISTNVKSLVDTNLTGGGQKLPNPEAFSILGIALVPEFGTAVADIQTLYNKSYIEICGSGNSVPFRVPTRLVTAGTGINRTDAAAGYVGSPIPGAVLSFPDEHAIEIDTGEQFYARIVFAKTGLTLTSTVGLMLVFWGLHKKAVGTQ